MEVCRWHSVFSYKTHLVHGSTLLLPIPMKYARNAYLLFGTHSTHWYTEQETATSNCVLLCHCLPTIFSHTVRCMRKHIVVALHQNCHIKCSECT